MPVTHGVAGSSPVRTARTKFRICTWCGSSAWLEYMPVTHGVAGSSPVRTARTKFRICTWCGSSAWLEYMPVTHGVAGSSPVRTAKRVLHGTLFCFISTFAQNKITTNIFSSHAIKKATILLSIQQISVPLHSHFGKQIFCITIIRLRK